MSNPLHDMLTKSPVIPVVTLQDADDAIPLAEALLAGGIGVIEITLRTDAGIRAIASVAKQLPEMLVGAGTIASADQFHLAEDAGAKFIVSPGLTAKLAEDVADEETPFLPGISSITELMHAREHGYHYLKFVPAALSGGPAAIKQFSGLFPDVRFCPTGGINTENMKQYLSLPSVMCVGGSMVAPDKAITEKNWEEITRLSQDVLAVAH